MRKLVYLPRGGNNVQIVFKYVCFIARSRVVVVCNGLRHERLPADYAPFLPVDDYTVL